jgi:transcriptional regulator with PAS, ATPase and Fis domain
LGPSAGACGEAAGGHPARGDRLRVLDPLFCARFYGRIRHEQKTALGERFPPMQGIVGESDYILDVCTRIGKYYAGAPAPMVVLITGPSGTGKSPVAEALHQCSPRRERPFIPVNCAAIPEPLFESELFGSITGAFTGATNRKGLMEEASGGTLFLDEIGQLPLNVQAKLLRAIENREIRPVGSSRLKEVDVRIIAATNLDLEKLVKEKRFLRDLYQRLSGLEVTLKPLVEHVEDLFLLAKHFLRSHSLQQGYGIFTDHDISHWLCSRYLPRIVGREDEPAVNIDQRTPAHVMFGLPRRVHVPAFVDLIPALPQNTWPGNVRQFQRDVEWAVVMGELTRLGDRPIVAGVLRQGEFIITSPMYSQQELETADLRIARDICQTLREAARLLGVSASWLSRQSKRLFGQRWRHRRHEV